MKKLHNLYHTLKHLKPTQLINRIQRKIIKAKVKNCPELLITQPKAEWVVAGLLKSSHVVGETFCFLNHEGDISNWNDTQQEKLWLYNLHYFDDFNAIDSKQRVVMHRIIINKWIEENPPLLGNGWEPYPQSLRIVNWVKWFLSGNSAELTWQESLWQQAAVLEQDLEYHLLGNHLFANAKALVFAGVYFDGKDATRWLNKGLSILDKELAEQILDDGANFELSPMYHNTILADMLDLINLSNTYQHPALQSRVNGWKEISIRMLNWMATMTHASGEVALFNDSAIGIAPTAKRINQYANKLLLEPLSKVPEKVTYLRDSGYIKLAINEQSAILDVARIGPDYIPGHAHADTLSFEWNYGTQRIFVNSGTSVYGLGDERLRQRKTEAHNTVVVDEEDSSEVWSGFRVARRAYPTKPIIQESADMVSVECSHNGYLRLSGKVTHTRNWTMKNDTFLIVDNLSGEFSSAKAIYHLHPDIVIKQNSNDVSLILPDGTQFEIEKIGADLLISDSTWHPEFGLSIANKKFVLKFKQAEVFFNIKRVK
ncbi:heparinase II/III family protein [Vibrio sp. 1-Bac 57]